jgi:hypothetical protein
MDPSFSTTTDASDNLHGGDFPIRSVQATLITGQDLTRGAVLGKITSGGKLNLSLSAAGDGSEDVYGILAEDMDATAEDKTVTVYVAGDFNEDALTIGTGHTADSIRDAFRDLGIHIRSAVPA